MSFATFDHIHCTEPDYLEPLPDATETAPVDWEAVALELARRVAEEGRHV